MLVDKKNLKYFRIDRARLKKLSDNIALELDVESNFPLQTWLYYARNPRIEESYFMKEFDQSLYKTKLFSVFRFQNKFISDFPKKYADERWHHLLLFIDPLFINQGWHLDLSEKLLERLNEAFSEKENAPFIWKEEKISPSSIKNIIQNLSKEISDETTKYEFNFILIYDGQQIIVGQRMIADLSKVVAIKKSSGEVIGADLSIRVLRKIRKEESIIIE
jgi:hypothetical protein